MKNTEKYGHTSIKFQPVIKWTGSKRSQLNEILQNIPKEVDTYYEPFCGSAAVLRGIIESDKRVNKYICSDINSDLIGLWNEIKGNPSTVYEHYRELWEQMNKEGNTIEDKKGFYNNIRELFNANRNPLDFMFIMRTTTNGMPRYNKNGLFNNSFHVTRNGIKPETLKVIIEEWSNLLNENNVVFKAQDYLDIRTKANDFMYLDPPYANTKGIYYGKIDYKVFWEWLKEQESKYILSFDGVSGEVDNTYKVPKEVYSKHMYIKSGNSSFKRTIGKSNNSIVYESLYIK